MFRTLSRTIKLPLNSLKFTLDNTLAEQSAKQAILATSAQAELTIKAASWLDSAANSKAEAKALLATNQELQQFMDNIAKTK
tara:strand:+ start:3584 stop:3829 length:246 start_codon:yes stop_codon:yes gene_type:complete